MEMIMRMIHKMNKECLLCMAWLFMGLAMQAQPCKLTVQEGIVVQGKEVKLPIELTNGVDISGGQFTVTFPEGVTVREVVMNEERSNGHTLEYRLNESGNSALILFYAQPTAAIKGNEGTLCYLSLAADAGMEKGEYKVAFSNVRLAMDAISTAEVTAIDGLLTVIPRYTIEVVPTVGGSVEGGGLFDEGSMVTLTALADNGYHFDRWSDGSTDNPYIFAATSNVNLKAEFVANTYTITYMVDGEVYATEDVKFGGTVQPKDEPAKEGHTFSGWSEIPSTMPASNVTITGTFTANSYKVTYILDGEVFKTEQVTYGTVIPTPEVPAKEGYNFSGWGEVPATMPAKELTFTGSYTINKDLKYNLVYIVDGVEYKRVRVAFGDAIILEEAPTKEGHTFSGWSEVPETMPLHDVMVKGTFTANSYTLTYVLDGETFHTETVVFGTAITAPETPTKEGYTFSGWSENPETMPAKDVTIEGSFFVNSYKVTYILDGEVFKTEQVTYGTVIPTPEVPAKEGYNFSGWGEVPATMPAKELTFTGSYTINKDLKYNLVYIVDGVEYKRVSVAFGDAVVLEEAPTKEGHTFSGWSEAPETMPLHDVMVKGTFTTNSYTLTYVLDGETFHTETVVFGTAITAPEAPTKEGYTFNGWKDVPESMPAKDVTITGTFSVNSYNLVYMVDGVEFNKTSVEFGSAITALEAPTKEGYTFSGWSEVPETMPAKDVTIEGTFSVNSYNLVYMVDGAEYNKTSVEFGSAITALEVPVKEGYAFSGWSEIPETMPAKDVTIEGSFSINTYTITYMVDGEVYATEQIAYGSAIVLKDAPVKEGYIFSGWSEAPETMPAADVVIEGTFTVDGIEAVVTNRLVDVYTLQGVMLKRQVPVEELEQELPDGIYIVHGKKMVIK